MDESASHSLAVDEHDRESQSESAELFSWKMKAIFDEWDVPDG